MGVLYWVLGIFTILTSPLGVMAKPSYSDVVQQTNTVTSKLKDVALSQFYEAKQDVFNAKQTLVLSRQAQKIFDELQQTNKGMDLTKSKSFFVDFKNRFENDVENAEQGVLMSKQILKLFTQLKSQIEKERNTCQSLPTRKPKTVAPTRKPTKAIAPTRTPVKAVAPTKKPVKAVASTKKPVKAVAPTKKPTKAVAPTKKPVKAVAPTKKPVKAVVPTKKPVKAVAPTRMLVKAVVPTRTPVKAVVATKKPVKAVVPTKTRVAVVMPTKKHTIVIMPAKKPVKAVVPAKKPVKAVVPTRKSVKAVVPTKTRVAVVMPTKKHTIIMMPTRKPVKAVAPKKAMPAVMAPRKVMSVVATRKPMAVVARNPVAVVATRKPIAVVARKPVAVVAPRKPVAVVARKPVAVVVKKPVAVVAPRKPVAVVARKPVAVVARKPVAVVAKKPFAVVVKKPVAIVARKPVAVVAPKKPVAVVVKKPVAIVARKPVAVVVKKPVAVVAKKPAVAIRMPFTFATATASGDPHTDTFDGPHHDTMVSGWFSYVKNDIVDIQGLTQLGCMPPSIPNTCLRSIVARITLSGGKSLTVSWGSWPPAGRAGDQNVVIVDSSGKNINTPARSYRATTFLDMYKVEMRNGNLVLSPLPSAVADPQKAVSITIGTYFLAVTLPKTAPHLGRTNGLFGFFNGKKDYSSVFRNRDGSVSRITTKSLCQRGVGQCGWASQQKPEIVQWAMTHATRAPVVSANPLARRLVSLGGIDSHFVLPGFVPKVTTKKLLFCKKMLAGIKISKKKYPAQLNSCLQDADSPSVARSIAKVIRVARVQQKRAKKALRRVVKQRARKVQKLRLRQLREKLSARNARNAINAKSTRKVADTQIIVTMQMNLR